MTTLGIAFIVVIFACVLMHIVSTILIAIELDKREINIHPLFFGLMTMINLNRYRELTLAETGRVGFLFYSYVVPINIALVLTIVGFATGVLTKGSL